MNKAGYFSSGSRSGSGREGTGKGQPVYIKRISRREREREREGGKAAEASEKRGRWIDVGRGCDVRR